MITEAAVEAGAEALNSATWIPWSGQPAWVKEERREQARQVLQAALPHLGEGLE